MTLDVDSTERCSAEGRVAGSIPAVGSGFAVRGLRCVLWGFSRAHLCACSIPENNAFGLRVSAVASHLNDRKNKTMSTTTNIQKVEAVRQPINALTALTRQLGLVDQEEVYGIMMKTVMPSGSSNEEVAAFCMTAQSVHQGDPRVPWEKRRDSADGGH